MALDVWLHFNYSCVLMFLGKLHRTLESSHIHLSLYCLFTFVSFILQFVILESERLWVVSDSLRPHGLYSPWNSPGKNTGMSSLSLLQGIFPTQKLNLGLPHCRQILLQPSHKGSPTVLEWVAYPFFSLPGPGIGTESPALQVDSLPTELSGKPWCFSESSTLRIWGKVKHIGMINF